VTIPVEPQPQAALATVRSAILKIVRESMISP
jgi:hypothetical protein